MSTPDLLPCHPADAAEEWARATLAVRTLLAIVAELRERYGEEWGEHAPALIDSPDATLFAIAEDLEAAGRLVTYRVGLWEEWAGTGELAAGAG